MGETANHHQTVEQYTKAILPVVGLLTPDEVALAAIRTAVLVAAERFGTRIGSAYEFSPESVLSYKSFDKNHEEYQSLVSVAERIVSEDLGRLVGASKMPLVTLREQAMLLVSLERILQTVERVVTAVQRDGRDGGNGNGESVQKATV